MEEQACRSSFSLALQASSNCSLLLKLFWISLPYIFGVGNLYTKIKIKETQYLSNLIGGEQKIGFKGFTLGVEYKVCQNDSAPR